VLEYSNDLKPIKDIKNWWINMIQLIYILDLNSVQIDYSLSYIRRFIIMIIQKLLLLHYYY